MLHANDRLLCFGNLEAMRGMIPARRTAPGQGPQTPRVPPPRRQHLTRPIPELVCGSQPADGAPTEISGTSEARRRCVGDDTTVRRVTATVDVDAIRAAQLTLGTVVKHTPVISSVLAVARPRRRDRPEGGEPPAHRLVQDPRCDQQGGLARRRRSTRRDDRQRGQPRPGARLRGAHFGVPCEIVVPVGAPINKIEACRNYGATVIEHGASLFEAVALSRDARRTPRHQFLPTVRRRCGDRRTGHDRARTARRHRWAVAADRAARWWWPGVGHRDRGEVRAPPRPDHRRAGERVRPVRRRRRGRRSGPHAGRRHRGEASRRDHRPPRRDLDRRDRHGRRGCHRRRHGAADGSGEARRRRCRGDRRGGPAVRQRWRRQPPG